eukprot:CAMPEP_0173401930 /NCGR_PEP_ID=MMETSP1356-20130122/52495_1 /TAXON_ID=77927 ORGANISM="Hemiselmis virescens, Strain PCC157" /NCGR_SAMPLE_ID=MMETSP1356 /ASSEMBLY_ACC=CAM_ASM_000847 /LENGTH=54 /DNA_ID=CAMNT_0014362183 /DNA_START=241 /DNA_END=405 /DNA_ORIENTATION=-
MTLWRRHGWLRFDSRDMSCAPSIAAGLARNIASASTLRLSRARPDGNDDPTLTV